MVFRVQGLGLRVWDVGFRGEGLDLSRSARRRAAMTPALPAVCGLGFRVQGAGFRVQGLGCRVQGAGFRAWGSGFRVYDLGIRG